MQKDKLHVYISGTKYEGLGFKVELQHIHHVHLVLQMLHLSVK